LAGGHDKFNMNKDSKIRGTVLANSGSCLRLAGTVVKETGDSVAISLESRALAIWGVNLPSTVGVKYTRAQLATVNLPPYVRDVIVGILLSDA
jgi:hypothetical protein